MPAIPGFCGPTYQAIAPNIDAELAINFFCEQSESSGAKSQIPMLLAPGKKLFSEINEAGVTSLYTVNGRAFAAEHISGNFWRMGRRLIEARWGEHNRFGPA